MLHLGEKALKCISSSRPAIVPNISENGGFGPKIMFFMRA